VCSTITGQLISLIDAVSSAIDHKMQSSARRRSMIDTSLACVTTDAQA
jgi:hypothetical protein